MPKISLGQTGAAAIVLLLLMQASIARADPVFCINKVKAYVAELDQLLAKERNWITPYNDLNKRYFAFEDCDTDALLEEVKRSRFIESIAYYPRVKEYYIHFSSRDVLVSFVYRASEKKSDTPSATWAEPSGLWVDK
jgi:hypothetical protein